MSKLPVSRRRKVDGQERNFDNSKLLSSIEACLLSYVKPDYIGPFEFMDSVDRQRFGRSRFGGGKHFSRPEVFYFEVPNFAQ
jgi:hypothetical protein